MVPLYNFLTHLLGFLHVLDIFKSYAAHVLRSMCNGLHDFLDEKLVKSSDGTVPSVQQNGSKFILLKTKDWSAALTDFLIFVLFC